MAIEPTEPTETVKCEIVLLGDHEMATSYRVTCSDGETGAFVRSISLPAAAEGGPPPMTWGLIAELLDGRHLSSVFIEIEAELWPLPPRHAPGGSIPALPGNDLPRPRPARIPPTGIH